MKQKKLSLESNKEIVSSQRETIQKRWQKFIIIGFSFYLILGLVHTLKITKGSLKADEPDITRRWVEAQYYKKQINPYPITINAVETVYGKKNFEMHEIGSVPQGVYHKEVITSIGTPESVYPPTNMFLFSFSIGVLPKSYVVPIWLFINIICLFLIQLILYKLFTPKSENKINNLYFILLLLSSFLSWNPVHMIIDRSQFGLLMFLLLLVGFYLMEKKKSWFLAGICFSLMLLKPTLLIPFLIIPIVKRKWKLVATTIVSQIFFLIGSSLLFRESPIALIKQWLYAAEYFAVKNYNINELLIDSFGIENNFIRYIILILLFVIAIIVFYYYQKKSSFELLTLAAFFSIFWTYHQIYDNVFLLIPLIIIAGYKLNNKNFKLEFGDYLLLGSFALLSLSLFRFPYFIPFPQNLVWISSWSSLLFIGYYSLYYLDPRLSIFRKFSQVYK